MRTKYLNIIIFLYCLFLFFFLRSRLVGDLLKQDVGVLFSFVIAGMFTLATIGVLLLKGAVLKKIYFTISFVLMGGWICYVSYLNSFYEPLSSFSVYFLIPLPYVSYCFFYKVSDKISNERIFYMFFLVTILLFFTYSSIKLMPQYQNILTNSAYLILVLLPFVSLLPSQKLKYIGFFLVVYAVIISFKRTGTIAISLSLLIYFIINNFKNRLSFKKILVAIPILIIICLFIYSFMESYDDGRLLQRFENIDEDGGSGRDEVWLVTWNLIMHSDFFSFLLGHGWDRVQADSFLSLSGHNDTLEIWYDFGLIGIILYFNFLLSYINLVYRSLKQRSQFSDSLSLSFVLFVILSLTSHIIIYPFILLPFACFWGLMVPKIHTN